MFVQSLADCVEGSTLSGEEEVGAGGVGELEIVLVVGESFAPEPHRCGSILAFAGRLLGVLVLVNFGHHVVLEPGVHYKVSAA